MHKTTFFALLGPTFSPFENGQLNWAMRCPTNWSTWRMLFRQLWREIQRCGNSSQLDAAPRNLLYVVHTRAAASKFGDNFLKKIASNTMQYLRWFASEAFPGQGLEVPVNSSDLGDTIRIELRQVREFVSRSELTVLEWSRECHSRLADVLEEEIEEDVRDPPYVPPKNGESSSSEEELEENPKPPKMPQRSNRRTHDGQVAPTLPVGDPPAPSADDDFSSDDSCPPVPKQVAKTRKHHAIRRCPTCEKPDANIKRHLLSHARKGHIEAEEVEKHLSCAIHKDNDVGPTVPRERRDLRKSGALNPTVMR